MKLIGAAICVASMCAVGVQAQSGKQTTTTKTDAAKVKETRKIDVKEGKDIKMTGCLERNPGGGYMLTDVSTGGLRYALVTDDDLGKYVNHRVQVEGQATDLGDAKIRVESKTKVDDKVGTSGDLKAKAKTEHEGSLGLPYLGVRHVKNLADSCH